MDTSWRNQDSRGLDKNSESKWDNTPNTDRVTTKSCATASGTVPAMHHLDSRFRVWSVWSVPDCWQGLKWAWVSLDLPPLSDRVVRTHSRRPGDLSWLNMGICFTCFYLLDSSSFPGKIFLACFWVSEWHWSSCMCLFRRTICPFIGCLHQKEDCWPNPVTSLYDTFSLNQQTADSLIQQVLTEWLGAGPWDRMIKMRKVLTLHWLLVLVVPIAFLFKYFNLCSSLLVI